MGPERAFPGPQLAAGTAYLRSLGGGMSQQAMADLGFKNRELDATVAHGKAVLAQANSQFDTNSAQWQQQFVQTAHQFGVTMNMDQQKIILQGREFNGNLAAEYSRIGIAQDAQKLQTISTGVAVQNQLFMETLQSKQFGLTSGNMNYQHALGMMQLLEKQKQDTRQDVVAAPSMGDKTTEEGKQLLIDAQVAYKKINTDYNAKMETYMKQANMTPEQITDAATKAQIAIAGNPQAEASGLPSILQGIMSTMGQLPKTQLTPGETYAKTLTDKYPAVKKLGINTAKIRAFVASQTDKSMSPAMRVQMEVKIHDYNKKMGYTE